MAVKKSKGLFGDEALSITIAISTALITALFTIIGGASNGAHQLHTGPTIETDKDSTIATSGKTNTQTTPEKPVQNVTPSSVVPKTDDKDAAEATPSIEATPIAPRPGANRYAENMRLDLPEIEFEARFPTGSSEEPAYLPIMKKIGSYRDRLKADAIEAKETALANDLTFHPWDVDIQFAEIQRSGNIVSAKGREYSYTGGAHPNLNWQGLIAEIDTGKSINLENLFHPRIGISPALAIAACEQLKQAKIERIGETTIDGEPIECASNRMKERIFGAEIALTSSDIDQKFGGILFMFAPYTLGPYVEGPYTIIVEQEIFHLDLRPEYQELFGGNALRLHVE